MRFPVPAKTVYLRYFGIHNPNSAITTSVNLQPSTFNLDLIPLHPRVPSYDYHSVQPSLSRELIAKQILALPYGQVAKVTDQRGVSQRRHSQLITKVLA